MSLFILFIKGILVLAAIAVVAAIAMDDGKPIPEKCPVCKGMNTHNMGSFETRDMDDWEVIHYWLWCDDCKCKYERP